MRRFYEEYCNHENLRQLVAEIPWGQNTLIFQRIKDVKAREYYIKATTEMGWSRNVLLNQIKGNTHERHKLKSKHHNLEKALPAHLAEQDVIGKREFYR